VWSAIAVPLALLAALWGTRLQHERDFVGLYAANLVVNGGLIVAIVLAGWSLADAGAVSVLGGGLLAAMVLRLAWQAWRLPRGASVFAASAASQAASGAIAVPASGLWAWAVLSAGLPLTLPFVARSLASAGGEGALATFNYAWKLVELPLVLVIQLVATLAFPAVARAVKQGLDEPTSRESVRVAFALAFALACACAAGLLVGADALVSLLFGWGRMPGPALAHVADWGRVAALGLLPQALAAVALTVLASQGRMRPAAGLYALALVGLLGLAWVAPRDGAGWMAALNVVFLGVALGLLLALGPGAARCLPVRAMAWPLAALLAVAALLRATGGSDGLMPLSALALAALAALVVLGAAWQGAGTMRQALRR
jgi:peptidoglycan biosynthesis protein MviN/MurJ (putative lipid II flippase)